MVIITIINQPGRVTYARNTNRLALNCVPVIHVGDRRSTTSFQAFVLLVCVIARERGEKKVAEEAVLIHRDEEKTSFDVNYRSKR